MPIKTSSGGNCFVISDGDTQILLDAGVTMGEFYHGAKLHKDSFDMYNISAIFITHKHSDHVKGAKAIAKELKCPIYITKSQAEGLDLEGCKVNYIETFSTTTCGTFEIKSYEMDHIHVDNKLLKDTVNFVVKNAVGERLNYVTDTGRVNYNIENCDIYLIECNYSETLNTTIAKQEGYATRKQERSKSQFGHLSLESAVMYVNANKGPKTKHMVAIHLSQSDSDTKMFDKYINDNVEGVKITTLPPNVFIDYSVKVGRKKRKSLY
jgi:phosphoribosyl 1,2-cyclic phosphodiesterase